eukprot:4823433-Lingulodinium_polyedra.AAC.1
MSDDRPSFFFLKGFNRLDQRGKAFVAQAAVTAWVPEGVLTELVEDSRIGRTYPSLRRRVAQDTPWLVQLPQATWATLAEVSQELPE